MTICSQENIGLTAVGIKFFKIPPSFLFVFSLPTQQISTGHHMKANKNKNVKPP
jgi:hypothetical protein